MKNKKITNEEKYLFEKKKFLKINKKKKDSEYKCIFHAPINSSDFITSIDIFEDKVVYGTIMGNVDLCRVDSNKLITSKNSIINKKQKSDIYNKSNSYEEIESFSKNRTSRENISLPKVIDIYADKNINNFNGANNNQISCIELKQKNNDNNNNNDDECSYTISVEEENENEDNNNDLNKNNDNNNNVNNNENNNNNENKVINQKNILITNKNFNNFLSYNKSKQIKNSNNTSRICNNDNQDTNANILIVKKKKEIENYELKTKLINNQKIKYPQITKIITKANENIPCLSFEKDGIINISIGDLELIRLENILEFNMNDKNSSYNFVRIKNYKDEATHITYCENCTCMLHSNYFLIIYTDFGEFDSDLKVENTYYENKNLQNYEINSGNVQMSNFTVPFDFDGDRFLYIEYNLNNKRSINIVYTLSKINNYEYYLSKEFGHINHMKLIDKNSDLIFLCRNNNQCEIHKINDDFSLVEKFSEPGNSDYEIISSYIFVQWEDDIFRTKDHNKKEIKENGDDEKNYENKNSKNKIKNNRYVLKVDNSNDNQNLDYDESNHHTDNCTFHKKKLKNIKLMNNYNNFNDCNSSLRGINFEREEIKKSGQYQKTSSDAMNQHIKINKVKEKEFLNSQNPNEYTKITDIYNKQNSIDNNHKLINSNNFLLKDDESFLDNNLKNKNINYYIATLDQNGNVYLYNNKVNKLIFNLYKINGMEDKFKNFGFFSMGIPYYIVMNDMYFAITTDFGLFAVSKINDENDVSIL